ncbi:MAG: 50S ribosomal protein L4 [Candidatus Levybacteria bacterium RIFCSPHIGHO2_01_FULL_36_15]|nr:MAG: 50S ribosomal protein L4 [Candidatus Levybacteria bacterium RIFCSPHIGHO2_01_FULL_36_15]OGH38375.1 MAG: 50S ribosomal protein L4 [Candidatus Levybacteria bacterium RIFCSPLOWO2_01_FULL_36_10]
MAKVLNKEGKATGEIKLPEEIFGAKINNVLMAQAVRVYLANQRSGTASTKTRGEVRGSTRKIYRQKGTGRARHGAIRAPIFVGGGIVFGPRPHSFSLNLPSKMKRKALFSALTLKRQSDQITILDIKDLEPKTREFIKIMKNLDLLDKKKKTANKVLFILPEKLENIERAARNVEGVSIEKANMLNTYMVLNCDRILFMKNSIESLSKVFLKG